MGRREGEGTCGDWDIVVMHGDVSEAMGVGW